MFNVIILAGKQPIRDIQDSRNKALIEINGKPMIEYVVEAVRNVRAAGKIAVIGPKEEIENILKGKVWAIIDSNESLFNNVIRGASLLKDDRFVLVTTCDIPMISKEAIEDFISQCERSKADFCYPIVEKEINNEKFPGMERTYVKTKEGIFTGGNLILVNPKIIEKGKCIGERLFKARKNHLRMAWVLGVGLIVKLFAGTLSIEDVEKRFLKVTGINGKAIISAYPELSNDIDKESDLNFARRYLFPQSLT